MRTLLLIIISFAFSFTVLCQQIGFGKYRLCYDMYWRCHFQNLIELKNDSTYEFIYLDDAQMMKTQGTWKIDPNFVVLTPFIIPDTIQITHVFETSNKRLDNNLIRISELFEGIPNLEINCFFNGCKKKVETDSVGEYHYGGAVVDSLTFFIKGRKLKVIPKKKDTPSIISITIDSDYKDLVYKQLGTNKIMIHNGKMMVKYKEGIDGELKTEYFEKIE